MCFNEKETKFERVSRDNNLIVVADLVIILDHIYSSSRNWYYIFD